MSRRGIGFRLRDYCTGKDLGPATLAQATVSVAAAFVDGVGVVRVDSDGVVRHESADRAVYGLLRAVYVEEG